MQQLRLFPPLGVIKMPLPYEVLSEARELLAELLTEVIEQPSAEERPSAEGGTHE